MHVVFTLNVYKYQVLTIILAFLLVSEWKLCPAYRKFLKYPDPSLLLFSIPLSSLLDFPKTLFRSLSSCRRSFVVDFIDIPVVVYFQYYSID